MSDNLTSNNLWNRLQKNKGKGVESTEENKIDNIKTQTKENTLEESKNTEENEKNISSISNENKENSNKQNIRKDELVRTTMKKDEFLKIKSKIQNILIEEIPLEELKTKAYDLDFRNKVQRRINELINTQNLALTKDEKDNLTQVLVDDAIGFGPIQTLLDNPDISEVMVNKADQVYVERKGKLELTKIFFDDDEHIIHIADKILSPLNRHVDESNPYVDARLPDGSRVNIIIPPLAVKGPCITIRKFSKDPLTIEDLVRFGTVSPEVAIFLDACVHARLNIVVSGGTGSGKTTTLNVLSSFIPSDERIVTVEDAAELQLRQPHVVTLEARPAGITGTGEVNIRTLVKNCLRMRPDRIIVGECRSGEALDMLQAMNTGHDGSMTTGHANTPRDMLARLETMVLMSGMELPLKAIREQIASAVDVIVQQTRLKDGSRRITHITEVQKMEGDVIVLQDIFLFKQTGFGDNGKILGKLEATGIRPSFMDAFETYNIELPNDVFYKK